MNGGKYNHIGFTGWQVSVSSSADGAIMPNTSSRSQSVWGKNWYTKIFFTAKGVEVEAVAQTFSHAEPGKQDVLMSVSVPSYVNMIWAEHKLYTFALLHYSQLNH